MQTDDPNAPKKRGNGLYDDENIAGTERAHLKRNGAMATITESSLHRIWKTTAHQTMRRLMRSSRGEC
jgi:hypothetical protein